MNSVCMDTLRLFQFRNYEQEVIRFQTGLNVICGNNAQGKTNLLESVFFLGAGKSCRTSREREMIRAGQTESRVMAEFIAEGRRQTVEAKIYQQARRVFLHNGVKLKSPRELLGRLPCVFFGQEEMGIVRAGASARRKFIDVALCQLRPRYMILLAEYNRIHLHKTRLLRENDSNSAMGKVLPDFNRRLAQVGAVLTAYRDAFMQRIAANAATIYREATKGREKLCLSYQTRPVYDENKPEIERIHELYALLMEKERAEWSAGRCLLGSHKDDVDIKINDMSARDYGSQGQTRTAALAMKLAERQVFCEELGAFPILLLDDVLSELDIERQAFVLNRVGEGQVMITCCDEGNLKEQKQKNTIRVNNGRITTE